VQWILKRTPFSMIFYQIIIFPVILILFWPRFWLTLYRSFKRLEWFTLLIIPFTFQYILSTFLVFNVERYWAAFLPFFYLLIGAIYSRVKDQERTGILLLSGLSLFLMITTGFLNNVLQNQNASIQPSLMYLIPPLLRIYW
jgi:hypothetical protein